MLACVDNLKNIKSQILHQVLGSAGPDLGKYGITVNACVSG